MIINYIAKLFLHKDKQQSQRRIKKIRVWQRSREKIRTFAADHLAQRTEAEGLPHTLKVSCEFVLAYSTVTKQCIML
eukprot:440936-Amphidinium_carterae.1